MNAKLQCLTGEGEVGLVRIIGNFEKPRVWKTGILYRIRLFVGKKWFMNCHPLLALYIANPFIHFT